MLLKFQGKISELEHFVSQLQNIIEEFETRQLLYFIEIERIYLINHDLQEQIGNYRIEINKFKFVRYKQI